jgi:hypothetical protein
MFRITVCTTALVIGIAALASIGVVQASDQPAYVFSSWQAGAVGNCFVTENHMTADCEPAPGLNGYRPPREFVENYLNNQLIPNAPVGKRVAVMIKLRDPPPEGCRQMRPRPRLQRFTCTICNGNITRMPL